MLVSCITTHTPMQLNQVISKLIYLLCVFLCTMFDTTKIHWICISLFWTFDFVHPHRCATCLLHITNDFWNANPRQTEEQNGQTQAQRSEQLWHDMGAKHCGPFGDICGLFSFHALTFGCSFRFGCCCNFDRNIVYNIVNYILFQKIEWVRWTFTRDWYHNAYLCAWCMKAFIL